MSLCSRASLTTPERSAASPSPARFATRASSCAAMAVGRRWRCSRPACRSLCDRRMASWTNPDQWERLRSGADCAVCRSKSDAVAELETSWVLVGDNDPIRGYACLVFARHAIELHDLSDSEGSALMRDIRKVSAAIAAIVR